MCNFFEYSVDSISGLGPDTTYDEFVRDLCQFCVHLKKIKIYNLTAEGRFFFQPWLKIEKLYKAIIHGDLSFIDFTMFFVTHRDTLKVLSLDNGKFFFRFLIGKF